MKWIKRIAVFLGCLYLVLCGVLYFQQERLIFHPRLLEADFAFDAGEEVVLKATDGITLSGLHFLQGTDVTGLEAPKRKPGVVLYLHGNRGSNQRSLYQTRGIRAGDYDTFLFDYRGYGKSGGYIASEAELLSDAQTAYDYLKERYAEDKIIIVGYSLGTGMASYLAANNEPGHCVLVAPYASITGMKNLFLWAVPDFILKYPLDNVARVAKANCPVTVIHGQADDFIPYTMAEEIRDAAPERVTLIGLPETGHRGAIMHEKFTSTVISLMN